MDNLQVRISSIDEELFNLLTKMYMNYATNKGFKSTYENDIITIAGNPIGFLETEQGIHRYITLNRQGLRKTSFALVEINPQTEEPDWDSYNFAVRTYTRTPDTRVEDCNLEVTSERLDEILAGNLDCLFEGK